MDSKALKLYKKINNAENIFIIFGSSYCGYCKNTKKYLKSKNISYKYYNIDKDYHIFFNLLKQVNKNLQIRTNPRTFPIIFYKKKFIGGYVDLINII